MRIAAVMGVRQWVDQVRDRCLLDLPEVEVARGKPGLCVLPKVRIIHTPMETCTS